MSARTSSHCPNDNTVLDTGETNILLVYSWSLPSRLQMSHSSHFKKKRESFPICPCLSLWFVLTSNIQNNNNSAYVGLVTQLSRISLLSENCHLLSDWHWPSHPMCAQCWVSNSTHFHHSSRILLQVLYMYPGKVSYLVGNSNFC